LDETQSTWTEVSRTADRRKLRERELVLQAMGIRYGAMNAEGMVLLLVRSEEAARAREQIERYERENAGWPPREEMPASISDGVWAAVVYALVIAIFFVLDHRGLFGVEWWEAGAARSAAIRGGEWWRAVTALTLHTDLSHLAGNLLFGTVFGVILARSVGSGVAWAGIALAGALGNWVNALAQPANHVSIGASTAVFGALGIQVAYEWMRRREIRATPLRRWAPIAMGFALFLWIGTGGGSFHETDSTREAERKLTEILGRVDVMAHVTGGLAGISIGLGLGVQRRRIPLSTRWQLAFGVATLAAIAGAWGLAL